jgi:hypothetical protein
MKKVKRVLSRPAGNAGGGSTSISMISDPRLRQAPDSRGGGFFGCLVVTTGVNNGSSGFSVGIPRILKDHLS